MDSNSQQPPAQPATTMDSNSVSQGSSSQQTAAVANQALATEGPSTAQRGISTVPRSFTAGGVLALRPVMHQQPRPKLPIFRPPAPAATVAERQLLQGSSSQMVPAVAAPTAMHGVSRPLAPATAAMLANPSPRSMQVDSLRLKDLQGSKLPVFREPPPRPELAGSVSGNALLQSTSSDTGPCVLNKQAGPPSSDSSSDDSGSDDELEMLDIFLKKKKDNEKL